MPHGPCDCKNIQINLVETKKGEKIISKRINKNGNFREKKTLKREKKRKVSTGQPTYCKNFVLIFFYILKTFDV